MKEIFLSNLRTALFGRIPTEEIAEVMDIVTTQLGKYELKVKPTEIGRCRDAEKILHRESH